MVGAQPQIIHAPPLVAAAEPSNPTWQGSQALYISIYCAPPPTTHLKPLLLAPSLLHTPLLSQGLEQTAQLLIDVSTSIKKLENTYLRCMLEKWVVRDPLWTTAHLLGTHWG